MSWGAVIGAGAGLIGGAMSSRSAKKAADVQSDAAKIAADKQLQAAQEANALQATMYKSGLAQNAPYQSGGQMALSSLMGGFGYGPARSSVGTGGTMAGGAGGTGGGGGGLVGSYVDAEGRAVDAQGNPIQSTDKYGIGDVNYGATQDELDQAAGVVDPGYFTKNFTKEDFLAGMDPGYQFRIDQGNAALNARRAAVGNRLGGQALKDISNYNQDAASQEYGSAFDRYNTNKTNLFNRLTSLATGGASTGAAAQQAGAGAGTNIGANTMAGARGASDYMTSGAGAQAGGIVGSTNAIVGGANRGLNNWYTNQIINRYTNPQSGGGGMNTFDDVNQNFGGWTGGH